MRLNLATIETDVVGDADTSFLGVSKSARGYAWRERLPAHMKPVATAISQRHGIPELMGRVLAARGIALDTVPTFLDPSLKSLMPDPSTLRDMDKAAARLADAIAAKENVAIFGDYDVDGACSSALMKRFLAFHDTPARIYIPDRLFEGYGPNKAAIESLVNEGARLIVTVDCGTTSHEPLAAARNLGADVIVIDHHQADERLPDVQCGRQSQPAGRHLRPGHALRGRRCLSRARGDDARTPAARALRRRARAGPSRHAGYGGAGDGLPTSCRSSGSIARTSKKGLP